MAKTALISVSDTTGLLPLAKSLVERGGYQLLVHGVAAEALEGAGIAVERVSSPLDTIKERDMDLVVAPLEPFERISGDVFADPESVMAQVDLEGVALLRLAAKARGEVMVVCDVADYEFVMVSVDDERVFHSLRGALAAKVFQKTAQYDWAVATFLENRSEEPDLGVLSGFPKHYRLDLQQAALLPHGENPHQQAALYGGFFDCLKPLQGKPLAYNHVLDVSAAVYLIGEFEKAAVAILKHNSPCGVASADMLEEAWSQALATDAAGAKGGVAIVNRTLDGALAGQMCSASLEVIVAPHFTEEALSIFQQQEGLRLLVVQDMLGAESLKEVRSAIGGVLVQDRDKARPSPAQWKVVSARQPTSSEWAGLTFAWRVVKHAKSRAAVIARGEKTVEIASGNATGGRGVALACLASNHSGKSLEGTVLVSDGSLESSDVITLAAEMGVTAVLQSGGEEVDVEVVRAADDANVAMVFTGTQHLKY